MQYPTPSELASSLKNVAIEAKDSTLNPFRVDILPVHGGKPPMYTVVILSASKEPLREKIGAALNRSFSLGVSSFTLRGQEAALLISKYGRRE